MTSLQSLEIATATLFALNGVTALVGMRLFGGMRQALLFAASNFLRMLGALLLLRAATGIGLLEVTTILVVAALVLLHRSFAEQLDRPRVLWKTQVALLAVTVLGVVLCAVLHAGAARVWELGCVLVGIQAALTASTLFLYSGEGLETAGRFAGASLLLYALAFFLRAIVVLRYGAVAGNVELERTQMVGLLGAMLSGAATTFGFAFLAAGKQRVELLWRAQIDELTGLLNRWAFKRIAVRETFRCMRKGTQMSVLMMDLDGMKRVNDRYGHGCGDAVLQAVASRLQDALRERDSIARMGGDEFCVLLPDTDLSEAVLVAERLRAEVDSLDVRYRSETVQVRASFGTSSTEQCGWHWQQLVDESDAALYEAKRGGNLRVVAARAAVAVAPEAEVEVAAEPALERRRGF